MPPRPGRRSVPPRRRSPPPTCPRNGRGFETGAAHDAHRRGRRQWRREAFLGPLAFLVTVGDELKRLARATGRLKRQRIVRKTAGALARACGHERGAWKLAWTRRRNYLSAPEVYILDKAATSVSSSPTRVSPDHRMATARRLPQHRIRRPRGRPRNAVRGRIGTGPPAWPNERRRPRSSTLSRSFESSSAAHAVRHRDGRRARGSGRGVGTHAGRRRSSVDSPPAPPTPARSGPSPSTSQGSG